MRYFFLGALASGVVLAQAAAPIPGRLNDVGWQVGKAGAGVRIDIFGDFSCDDTSNAWFQIVKPLVRSGQEASIIYHAFPLPYHHNSFDAAQSGRVMTEYFRDNMHLTEKEAFIRSADALFANQTQFMSWQTPNPTENLTQSEVISNIFAPIAVSVGIPRADFLHTIQNGWNVNDGGPFSPTRDAWKYGAALSVCGTPTFAANGVFDDSLSEWTLTNWTTWISSSSSSPMF